MLLTYFLMTPNLWPVPWLLQSLGYFFVLKKMGLGPSQMDLYCAFSGRA